MKVLICVRKMSSGGTEILESRLAVELNKTNIYADLLGQYDLGFVDSQQDVTRWEEKGVPKVLWLKSNSFLSIVSAVYRLINIIRSNKYSYVITTNTGLDTIASIARVFVKFKHIVALHSSPHPSIVKRLRFRLWEKLASKSLYKGYAISEFVKQSNLKYLNVAADKISVIYNSIDLDTFTKPINEEDKSKIDQIKEIKGKKLLFIGRLIQSKGIDILLKLLAQLPDDVSLIIAGDSFDKAIEEGAANYRDEIISIIKQLQLEERVVLLGQCKEIYTIMSQCDVLVHLPRHEGFGLVLLEAFAANLPVVTSNIGGIPEVIKNTSYKAINLDDTDGLLAEIDRLLSIDASEKLILTQQAKNTLEYFSDKRRAKDIVEKVLI